MFPHLNFVVQDLNEDMLAHGRKAAQEQKLGEDWVSFTKADFFGPQTYDSGAVAFFSKAVHAQLER